MCEARGRALLVDDDAGDRAFYSEILRAAGFEVSSCPSYQEGARRVCLEAFDLIVVSQGTTVFEGREVLERAIERDRHLPVLVLTRSLHMQSYLDAMWLGALDYLEKPVPAEQIGRILETYLWRSTTAA